MTPFRLLMWLFLALLSGPATGVGGELPNFSGTWELDRSRSVIPARSPSLFGMGQVKFVIDHQGTTLKIERRAKVMGMERSFASEYYTDGREATNRTPLGGHAIVSRSKWRDDEVVIELRGTVEFSGKLERMEGVDVLRLSEDGRTLYIQATRKLAEDAPEVARLVFVRR